MKGVYVMLFSALILFSYTDWAQLNWGENGFNATDGELPYVLLENPVSIPTNQEASQRNHQTFTRID